MRRLAALVVLLVALAAAAQAQPPRWQEVVGALAAERTRAETCVRLLKRHAPDAATVSRGELDYGDAKAEMDRIINSLAVVVAEGGTPAALPDLEQRLAATVAAREAFCTWVVEEFVPGDDGTKSGLTALFAPADALIDGVFAVILDAREADRLERETIRIQLEAQSWPDFASVQP